MEEIRTKDVDSVVTQRSTPVDFSATAGLARLLGNETLELLASRPPDKSDEKYQSGYNLP